MAVLWLLIAFLSTSLAYGGSSKRIDIDIRSEGCDDPKLVNVRCGRAYIKVNGRDYAKKRRGHNVVLVDYLTGRVEQSLSFDTSGSPFQAVQMRNLLIHWSRTKPGKVVLIAIQDDGSRALYRSVQDAIVGVGGTKPFTHGYRGSYALVGYTGPGRPFWIKQVQNTRRQGPSLIKINLSEKPVTGGPPRPTTKITGGPVPPTQKPVTPPVGSCGVPGISSRVIGGTNASPGAWPWQIALLSSGRFSCGGSLIYADWIATAAHCIRSRVGSSYTVLLGAHNRNSPQSHEQRIRGKRVIVHPRYGRLNNDIALIQLERPATLSSRVSTVCLPSNDLPLSSTCYITGWGKIKHPGSSHHILQQAKLPPVDKQECQRKNGRIMTITDQMLCAGQRDTILSGCHGDSGGPYVCRDSSNPSRFVLHGIVSWGSTTCAASESYTVFARVSKFRSWIDQEIKKALG